MDTLFPKHAQLLQLSAGMNVNLINRRQLDKKVKVMSQMVSNSNDGICNTKIYS